LSFQKTGSTSSPTLVTRARTSNATVGLELGFVIVVVTELVPTESVWLRVKYGKFSSAVRLAAWLSKQTYHLQELFSASGVVEYQ